MTRPTLKELHTQDIIGYPVDWAVYQTMYTPELLSKAQLLDLVAERAAKQVKAQIQLNELRFGRNYSTQEQTESKSYSLANLGLSASQMPEEIITKALTCLSGSSVFQGMFVSLIAECIVFGAAYLVARYVLGWNF